MGLLPKAYQAKDHEKKIYELWEKSGKFSPPKKPKSKPFVISIPPANVTGELHLGHAMMLVIEDILIRFHRMKGDDTLWLPGTDHAGIATQKVVEDELSKQGKNRQDLGREKFIQETWRWKEKYHERITEQIKRMGSSVDWTRERFTMDEGLSDAVTTVFVKLFEEGLIYQGERLINWCPKCETVLSDIEVEHSEVEGKLITFSYPLADGSGNIKVATTRPETMLGDTAVAVNPKDKRFAKLVGKKVLLPIMNREIPIIADEFVDTEFGTGAVKVTPSHDPNDYAMGKKHKLKSIQVIGFDGKMTDQAGKYAGLTIERARADVVAEMKKLKLLVKEEPYSHKVGHCYRCRTAIEPLSSKQWFVDMKPLVKPALDAVKRGDINIVPTRFTKTYYHWLENIQDWCISRQLWWGHRIPVWYCEKCGQDKPIVQNEAPKKCPYCSGTKLKQDEDVLDTWFSSALWPFSTLGWPENTPDLKRFYPTTVMETGYDIIFFWVARMIMMGLHFTGKIPFQTVYLHGLIRDAKGRKMTKSLGNGIDPLEMIDQFGTDALRFMMATSTTPGNDLKFNIQHVKGVRNFANKIWNISRFIQNELGSTLPLAEDKPLSDTKLSEPLTTADKWILTRLEEIRASATSHINHFRLGLAGTEVYDFAWHELADWYLEIAKIETNTETKKKVLAHCLIRTLKLLHPFMPFITETIWQEMGGQDLLMTQPWPIAQPALRKEAAKSRFSLVKEIVTTIRNVKADFNIPPVKKLDVLISTSKKEGLTEKDEALIMGLARLSGISTQEKTPKPKKSISFPVQGLELNILWPGDIDTKKLADRLKTQQKKNDSLLKQVEKKLKNKSFLTQAPAKVKEGLKKQKSSLASQKKKISNYLAEISKL